MTATKIPKHVAAAIKKCWPQGVVEEFPLEDSYFHEIQPQLEVDLRRIPGSSVLWHTEVEGTSDHWYDDWENEPPPTDHWQSYHVIFLAPTGREFHFEDQTADMADPDGLEDEELNEATYPGEGWIGCAVGISLAARFAAITFSQHSRHEDGSMSIPDVESVIFSSRTNRRVNTTTHYREILDQKAFQTLEELRGKIAAVLLQRRIRVLDESVLNLPVRGLRVSEDLFLQEPLRVRDAFFFRGA